MRTRSETSVILIVDDDNINRLVLKHLLAKLNCEIVEAIDGFDALDKATKHKPDLILLDIMMPHLDGFETAKRLKSSDITKDIPIIFVSSLNDPASRHKATASGGEDLVVKPLTALILQSRVDKYLK